MHIINIATHRRTEFVDITSSVKDIISKEKAINGMCVLVCTHTTAALTINENADPTVQRDIIEYLNRLVPERNNYLHSEGNSDSHIKSSLLGNSLNILVENKKLILGTWQGIYFCEFDGPRKRKIYAKFIGG